MLHVQFNIFGESASNLITLIDQEEVGLVDQAQNSQQYTQTEKIRLSMLELGKEFFVGI
jgi:hypothetical protein